MKRRQGLSLLEVMVSLGALALITMAIYGLVAAGSTTYANTTRQNTLQENGRRVLDQMSAEFRLANPDTLVVGTTYSSTSVTKNGSTSTTTVGVTTVSFQVSTGFEAGVTTWGSTIEYAYEASDVDSNNNSIKDEGRLVRSQDGETVRLCDYVKAGGFTAVKTGSTLALTLTLQVADEKNKVMEKVVGTTVVLRNKSGT